MRKTRVRQSVSCKVNSYEIIVIHDALKNMTLSDRINFQFDDKLDDLENDEPLGVFPEYQPISPLKIFDNNAASKTNPAWDTFMGWENVTVSNWFLKDHHLESLLAKLDGAEATSSKPHLTPQIVEKFEHVRLKYYLQVLLSSSGLQYGQRYQRGSCSS